MALSVESFSPKRGKVDVEEAEFETVLVGFASPDSLKFMKSGSECADVDVEGPLPREGKYYWIITPREEGDFIVRIFEDEREYADAEGYFKVKK
jgi:hypothetical protein